VAVTPPNCTAVAPLRFMPAIRTVFPPPVEPLVGVKEPIVGARTVSNRKSAADVAVPLGVVTEIVTVLRP
jgi:hypothetical protein